MLRRTQKILSWQSMALAFALSLSFAAAAEPALSPETEFVATFRCMIMEQFKAISERGMKSKSTDRYFILAMQDKPQSFVQCIFYEFDWQLLCEASSGRYGPRPGEPYAMTLSADQSTSLTALGFAAPTGVENFKTEIALGSPPDFESVSEMLLKAMYSVYGARIETPMTLTTPLLGKLKTRLSSCKPVS